MASDNPRIRGRMDQLRTSFGRKGNAIERILETAEDGSGITEQKIIYSLLISPFDADQCLSTILRNGLLRYDSSTRAYKITEQGVDFLESLRQISELDNEIE